MILSQLNERPRATRASNSLRAVEVVNLMMDEGRKEAHRSDFSLTSPARRSRSAIIPRRVSQKVVPPPFANIIFLHVKIRSVPWFIILTCLHCGGRGG